MSKMTGPSLGGGRASPHLGAYAGERLGQRSLVAGRSRGRSGTASSQTASNRRDPPGAEVLDVGTALAAAGEHQHGLDEHLAPVVERQRSPGRDP